MCLYTVAKMQSGQVSFMAIALLCLLGQEVYGQIPTACSDVTSLESWSVVQLQVMVCVGRMLVEDSVLI